MSNTLVFNSSNVVGTNNNTFKYPTLKTSELMKIPIQKIAKKD